MGVKFPIRTPWWFSLLMAEVCLVVAYLTQGLARFTFGVFMVLFGLITTLKIWLNMEGGADR